MAFVCVWTGVGDVQAHTTPQVVRKDGYRFPAIKISYTQYRKRWNLYIRTFNFTSIVGRKPFVMLYYKPGHAPSEVELVAFDKACKVLQKKVECFAIAPIRRYREIRSIYRRLRALRLSLRVLLDRRRTLSYLTLTKQLPCYSAVTRTGFLRVVNAASLSEYVQPKKTFIQILRSLATGQDVHFIRAPGFSPNPFVKVGTKLRPFQLPYVSVAGHLTAKKMFRSASKKPIFMFFWSVQCAHCRRLLPMLDRLAQRYTKHFSIVGFVQADTQRKRKQIQRFLKKHSIQMDMCLAPKGKLLDQYNILRVPTLLLVDSEQKIQNVHMGIGRRIERVLLRMVHQLKK